MNATNRVVNRGLLFVFGVILLGAGATATVAGLRPDWLGPWPGRIAEGVLTLGEPRIEVTSAVVVPVAAVVALAAALLLAVLLVIFIFTRGRGKTRSVLRVDAEGGRTVVDRDVADAVLAATLSERADVLSARAGAYLVRRARAIELAVTVQRGASLDCVLAAAESAVDDWDALLGARVPILVHLTDRSWRDGLRSRNRVQ